MTIDPVKVKKYQSLVNKSAYNVHLVPKLYRTLDLIKMAIKKNGNAIIALLSNERVYEVCFLSVEKHWANIQFVPTKNMKPSLILIAVKQNGEALKYVPLKKRTLEACRIAMTTNPKKARQYVPAKFLVFIENTI